MRGATGVALPEVLLLIMALTGLAHGLLVLADETRATAAAVVRVEQARLAAEAPLALPPVAAPPTPDTLPGWGAEVVREGTVGPRARFRLLRTRVGRELHLLEAEGWVPGVEGRRRAARILWALEPGARVAGWRAALEAGAGVAVAPGSTVSGASVAEAPAGWESVCAGLRPVVDSVFPGGNVPPTGPLSSPAPEGAPRPPWLGMIPGDTLRARADAEVAGEGTPSPRSDAGVCDGTDPWNWGSPSDPGGPCGGRLPLVVAPADLTIRGGEGQGLLVVAGDLALRDGAFFAGAVLVGGRIEVSEGSRIEGLVRAWAGAEVAGGAEVRASACPALRALVAVPSLRRYLPPSGGSWLPSF